MLFPFEKERTTPYLSQKKMNSVLLIDDDMEDVGLFKEALKKVGPSVLFHYFDNGNEGIQALLAQEAALPDLIFLDINMPAMNGWQCLARLKQEAFLKHLAVIMYSTSSEPREIEMAKELGAIGIITKPDSFTLLKKTLAAVLATPVTQLTQSLHSLQ